MGDRVYTLHVPHDDKEIYINLLRARNGNKDRAYMQLYLALNFYKMWKAIGRLELSDAKLIILGQKEIEYYEGAVDYLIALRQVEPNNSVKREHTRAIKQYRSCLLYTSPSPRDS